MSMVLGQLYVFVWGWRKGIDDTRHNIFVEAKRDLEVLPPTHGALELHVHITRANFQAKI